MSSEEDVLSNGGMLGNPGYSLAAPTYHKRSLDLSTGESTFLNRFTGQAEDGAGFSRDGGIVFMGDTMDDTAENRQAFIDSTNNPLFSMDNGNWLGASSQWNDMRDADRTAYQAPAPEYQYIDTATAEGPAEAPAVSMFGDGVDAAPIEDQNFVLADGAVPAELQNAGPQADLYEIIRNINKRFEDSNNAVREATKFNGYDLTTNGLVGGQMAYSPEMAARLGVDERIDYGLGDEYYTSSDAIRDIEAELKRNGINDASGLVQGTKGSHNDLYPNLGIGNRLYQTSYNPKGGRSRDVVFEDDARKQEIGSLIGREKGHNNLFDNPIYDVVAAALAPVTGGISVAALAGAKAATGTTLKTDDAINIAGSLAAPYLPGGGEAASIGDVIKAGGREAIEQVREDDDDDRQVVWNPASVSDILGDAQVQIPDYSEEPPVEESEEGGSASDSSSSSDSSAEGGLPSSSDSDLEPVFDGIPDPVDRPSHDWPDANYEFESDPDYTTEATQGGNIIITHTETGATRTVGDPGRDQREETTERKDDDPPTDDLPDSYRWVIGESGDWELERDTESEEESEAEDDGLGDSLVGIGDGIEDSTDGDGQDTGNSDNTGTDTTGNTDVSGDTTGDPNGGTNPTGDPDGDGDVDGDDDGNGDGTDGDLDGNGEGGSGGQGAPSDQEWSELFPYTKITPALKKKLLPHINYIRSIKK